MNITFDPKSETYRKFGAFMNQSILMFTKNAIEELKGVKAALAMPNMAAHGAGAMPNGLTGPISLEKLFEKYLADPSQPRNKKTYENYIVAGSVLNKNY